MLNFIDKILFSFESCFSREAAFRWFVILTVGLMLRSDKLGVTCVIRDPALKPDCYLSMLHFFRASSWSLDRIRQCWFQTVLRFFPLYQESSFHVLVGDGVKQSKEGRRIPGVKKLCQESENSAKPQFIHGHMFGGLGILAGSICSMACVPLSLRLHDGLQDTCGRESSAVSGASHVVQMVLYGKKEKLRYYSIDLLWGQKLYQELRFVLVEYNKTQSILAGTSLELDPLSMIRLYSFRFRIECTFRELKQQTGAFCYHFWSKHMPRLNYYRKKTELSPLEQVKSDHARRKIMQAVRAVEMHMTLSCIAMGSVQCLLLRMKGKLCSEQIRYQCTPSKGKVSEGAMMHYLRKHIFRFMGQNPELRITRLIQEMQEQSEICEDLLAS